MSPFDSVVTKLKPLTYLKYIKEPVKYELRLKQEFVIDLVENRWKKGEGVNGGIIGVYKSQDYAFYKQNKNPLAGGDVDLIDTGKLKDELFVGELSSNRNIIKSADYKYDILAEKYGAFQFGITNLEYESLMNEVKFNALQTILNKVYG